MFDIAFSELLVIAIVALLVIGPEKLPKVARTVGAFTGRMQRYVAQVKEEVNREARFEELQKLQQEIKQSVENNLEKNIVKPIEQQAAALQASIYEPLGDAKKNTALATTKKRVKTTAAKPKVTASKKTSTKPITAKPIKAKPA